MATNLVRKLHIVNAGTTEVVLTVHQKWLPYQTFLDRLLPQELRCEHTWTTNFRFETQQILTGGPCVTLKPSGYCSPTHFLPSKHAEFRKYAQGTSVIFDQHPYEMELFFIPVMAQGGKGMPYPAFWGYLVHKGVALRTCEWVENSQLPVILDLDETLLVAHSASQLQTEIAKLAARRHQCIQEAATANTDRKRILEINVSALAQEIASFDRDAVWLEQYIRENAVTATRGALRTTEQARLELAYSDEGVPLQRPVVRLPDGVVFTRIQPANANTSMIMRIRPGWELLRSYLAPRPGHRVARRVQVYVCTAADAPYAHEAWRLLDHNQDIIPQEDRGKHIMCTKKIKEVSGVLRCQKPILLRQDGALADEPRRCAMPLAIIVDDRIDVWEPESRDQVLQVVPFAPHRPTGQGQDQMNSPQVKQDMTVEMASVTNRIAAVRAHVHHAIKQELSPQIRQFLQTMHPLEAVSSSSDFFPTIQSVAELLKVPNLGITELTDAVNQLQAGQGMPPLAQGNNQAPPPQGNFNMLNGGQAMQAHGHAAPINLLPVEVRNPKRAAPAQPLPTQGGPRPRLSSHQAVPMTTMSLPPPITLAAPHHMDPLGLHRQSSGLGAGPSGLAQQPHTLHHQASGLGGGPGGMGLQQLSLHQHQQAQPPAGPQDPRRQKQQPPVQQQQLMQRPPPMQQQSLVQQPHFGHVQHVVQRPQVPPQQQQQRQQQHPQSGLLSLLHQHQPGDMLQQQQPGVAQDGAGLSVAALAYGAPLPPSMRQADGPTTSPQSGTLQPLSVNLALPLIRQKMKQTSYNPINALKEASEKQKITCKHVEMQVAQPSGVHPVFGHQILWEGQEIGTAKAHDKKSAKKEAARKAVEYLLLVGNHSSSASVSQSDASRTSSSGAHDGASGKSKAGEAGMITDLNALSMLQKAYPARVTWRPSSQIRGMHEETVIVDDHHIVRAWKSKSQTARRWAAVRMLMELGHPIDPAFFQDTLEGKSKGSMGPFYTGFLASTEVLVFKGQKRPQGWTQYSSFPRQVPPPQENPSQGALLPTFQQQQPRHAQQAQQIRETKQAQQQDSKPDKLQAQQAQPAKQAQQQDSEPELRAQQAQQAKQAQQQDSAPELQAQQAELQQSADLVKLQAQKQQQDVAQQQAQAQGIADAALQGPLRERPQSQDQAQGQNQVHGRHKAEPRSPTKRQVQGHKPGETHLQQSQGNSRQLMHSTSSKGQSQKQKVGRAVAEGQGHNKQAAGQNEGKKPDQPAAVPASRGQKRAASTPAAASADAPEAKRAKPAVQAAPKQAVESAHAASVRANADRLAEAAEPSSPKRIADVEEVQDDSLAEAMSEDNDSGGVGHQSGYMLETSPETDAVGMDEDSRDVSAERSPSYDVNRASDMSHFLHRLRSPKQQQATKDVNALHDVKKPEFFAAAQQQSKVKEGDWAEVKSLEADGSGNVVID